MQFGSHLSPCCLHVSFSVAITTNRVLTTYISVSRCRDLHAASRSLQRPTRDSGAAARRIVALGVVPGVLLGASLGAWLAHDILDGEDEIEDRSPLLLFFSLNLILIAVTIGASV